MILLIMICYQHNDSTMIHRYKMNYMQASLEKIQFIILDKERQPMTLQLNHNVTIQSVLNVQYTCLNIHVDVELNLNHRIALLYNNNNNSNSLFQTFVHIHNKNIIIRNTYIQ